MKTKRKAFLAVLVALVMLLVIVPITVFAGSGTQEDPFVAADKTADGTSKHCLELWLCDENGKPIQSLEKYFDTPYQMKLGEKYSFYVTVKYANGEELNKDDWVTINSSKNLVYKSEKLMVYAAANELYKIVSFNGKYYGNGTTATAANPRGIVDFSELPMEVTVDLTDCPGYQTNSANLAFAISDGEGRSVNTSTFYTRIKYAIVSEPDNKIGIDETSIADIPAQTYTGEAITPELNITYDGKTLVKDTDYTVEFANNTEVGTASVTITGIGDYDWHVTKTFEIKAPPATSNTWITFPEGISFVDCDDNTDYYQADKPLAFNKDGTITFTYKVNGAQRYGHVALQNDDGSTPAKATATEPDGNDRVATLAGLSDKTDYRLYWDKTKTNGRLTKDIVLTFTTAEHEHVAQKVDAVPATCTESGTTEGSKCSICGEWIVEPETVPALGHIEEVVKGKAATCTEKGLTDGKKCSVCGETLKAQEEIPALGHTEEVVKGKAATCTEKGLTDGKKCSVCNAVLEEQKEIPALGHDFKDGKCTRCGEKDPDYKPAVQKQGFVKDEDGVIRYYEDDKVATGVTDVKYDPKTGNWYNTVKGIVTPGPTVQHNAAGWWYIDKDGKVDFNYTGLASNDAGTWYCKNAKVDFSVTGVVYDYANGEWIYVKNNKLTMGPTVQYNDAGWWYVNEKGRVDFKYNGLGSNAAGTWVCQNSKVDFKYNGKYNFKGKTYTVQNSKVIG